MNEIYDNNIPQDFDWEEYVKINKDLKFDNETDAIKHYINHGMHEQRMYKINFNLIPSDFIWSEYIEINKDLHYIDNERESLKHYLEYGINENRLYNRKDLDKLTKERMFKNKYKHFYNKYDITLYDNIDKNSTKFNYNYKQCIKTGLDFKCIPNIDNIDSFILVIDFPKLGGGTTYFLSTIIEKYKYNQTFVTIRNDNNMLNISINDEYMFENNYSFDEYIIFIKNNINKISKIFVNHMMSHTTDFIQHLFTLGKEVTYITHDYYALFNNPQPIYTDIIEKNLLLNDNPYINKFNQIITQNVNNLFIFDEFLNEKSKIIVTELPDYKHSQDLYETQNEKIIIAFVGDISNLKGREFFISLNNYIEKNNLNIETVVFGEVFESSITPNKYWNINDFNALLIKYKPNVLIECSMWPETYSYSLTLMMKTQLPILSIKKSFKLVIHNRLKKYDKFYQFENTNDCISKTYKYKQNYFYTINPTLYYNSFWDNYFITKKEKLIQIGNIKNNIKPYLIYFPQFHNIEENSTRFYNGYSDISNLDILQKKITNDEIEIPCFDEFGINNINEYNLTNNKIIQKQIDILDDYNMSGFALYYYWFSNNSITNKNMVMDKVINQFFNNNLNIKNKKVFFIWANEDWSKNAAFGEDNSDISNKYDIENIHKNIENLINYFKHDNYLKINNKPVFFIYHPFIINDEDIDLFYDELNRLCILNSFSGVHLVLNSFSKLYQKYKNFYINFNYKNNTSAKIVNNQIVFDYHSYINDSKNTKQCIQTIVFDFDNRARLIEPDRTKNSTICLNNSEFNKLSFIDKIIETYKDDDDSQTEEIDKLLLINAFNEWGEKMTFEPSNQYKYYNLNLLSSKLIIKEP
jgi:hypothetical protein